VGRDHAALREVSSTTSTPIEWVCGSPEALNDELNEECVELPTGAARWCCAESFAPACADN